MKKAFYKLLDIFDSIKILKLDYFRIMIRFIKQGNYWISFWKKTKKIIGILILLFLFVYAVRQGYKIPWTGFSSSSVDSSDKEIPKTLWDWMELLIIPCFLGFLAYLFTNSQKNREIAVAQINKRDKALQQYYDYMTNLLINNKDTNSQNFEVTKRIARAATLAVLEILDGNQKGHIFRFLYEAELIKKGNQFIDLRRANLENLELAPGSYDECILNGANLDKAKLIHCNFYNSEMSGITMEYASLESADFSNTTLSYALLSHSDLFHANLRNAQISKVDLRNANLQHANLSHSIIGRSNLSNANLQFADLSNSYLRFSNLAFSNLKNAVFANANLVETNMYGSKLRNSILNGADLSGSNITKRQINNAISIEGAILPSEFSI